MSTDLLYFPKVGARWALRFGVCFFFFNSRNMKYKYLRRLISWSQSLVNEGFGFSASCSLRFCYIRLSCFADKTATAVVSRCVCLAAGSAPHATGLGSRWWAPRAPGPPGRLSSEGKSLAGQTRCYIPFQHSAAPAFDPGPPCALSAKPGLCKAY